MTISGWVFMTVSLSAVMAVVATCYYKVLTAPREQPRSKDEDEAGVDEI